MIGRIAPVAAAAGFAIMARNARAARQRCSAVPVARSHARQREPDGGSNEGAARYAGRVACLQDRHPQGPTRRQDREE